MSEVLAEQPTHEQLRSFDPLASIDMLRFDLQMYGQVLPETWRRIEDEELSYLAEGVDRASRTAFALRREADSLVYFDDGQWRPYTGMLMTGLEVAEAEAKVDPRRQFLLEWARRDVAMGYKMRALKPGERLVWTNSFPHMEAARFGDKFMRQCGLQADRRMGFIYKASCQADGTVILESQTVDLSDAEAFQAVNLAATYDEDIDLDGLTRTYDGVLKQKFGGHFYAGRREAAHKENGWEAIRAQRDLITYFMQGLQEIAALDVDRQQLERLAKEHVYGVWATFKKRLDGKGEPRGFDGFLSADEQFRLSMEVQRNFNDFVSKGRVLIGCGGEIDMLQGQQAIMEASGEDVFSAIFGNGSQPERYSFNKRMYCVVCQAPPKENTQKKWCGPCGICRACDGTLQARNSASGLLALLT